ncbi:MAG: response regulator, partial [Algicola sp.]|nr:response regulator [Algicola sp.]
MKMKKENDVVAQILIVDDEPHNHVVYERVLSRLGLQFIKAMSGQQALGLAHKHDFFLILMDVQMPGMDGFETATLILEHPKTAHIPIIFITAFAGDETFEFKGYDSGAVDFMVKPISGNILRHKVEIFLSLFAERVLLKKALKTIQVNEKRYRTLFECSSDAVFLIDSQQYCFLDANQAAIELTGQSLEALQMTHCNLVFSGDIVSEFGQITATQSSKDFGTITFSNKNGKRRLARFNLVYLDHHTQVGIARDITDEQNMQQQLRHTQKMEAVGQLTGGIAHDFNNILAIILGNIELMKRQISDDKLAEKANRIEKSANRAVDLISQLLRFSSHQAEALKAIDINQVIRQMDTLIGRSVTPQIKVEHHFTEDLWLTAIDAGDFEDALLNLVVNAYDAIGGSGQIV